MALTGLPGIAVAAGLGAFRSDDKTAIPAGSVAPVTKVTRIPSWEDSPEAYERVIIKGVTLPGSATVSGDGYKRRTDTKKAAGKHGETTTDLGQEAVDIDVSLEIWGAEQLASFHELVKKVLAPKRKVVKETKNEPYFVGYTGADASTNVVPVSYNVATTTTKVITEDGPGPVSIYYPTLAIFGITKVQVISISLPTPKSRDVWTVRLKCKQYIARKDSKVTTNEKVSDKQLHQWLGGNAFENSKPSVTTIAPNYTPAPTVPSEPKPARGYPPSNYRVLDKW